MMRNVFIAMVAMCVVLESQRCLALQNTIGKNVLRQMRLASTMERQPAPPKLTGVPTRINQVVDPNTIEAVNIRHITVATEDLAKEIKNMIVSQVKDFSTLAATVSLCPFTKDKGGELGWIKNTVGQETERVIISKDEGSSQNSFELEFTLPPEVINAALYMNKGDLVIKQSQDSWHVLQLLDTETKLSPALKKRRRQQFLAKKGHISGGSTYFLDTMGCQMNVADSERMEGQLLDMGFTRSEDAKSANLVILNTCSIRDHAEQKVYSYLGPHAIRKRHGEDVSLVVAGCVAQQEGEKLMRKFPEIDIVMGPQYANRIVELLDRVNDGNQVVATDPIHQLEDTVEAVRRSDTCAFVNVIYGCNERCTYCVVPTTRGVEQSRTKEAIVAEMTMLAESGYREVTLLGQNVDSWGRDMNPKQKFADLLKACGQVEGIDRVRFLTSHPKYMSKRVISAVAESPKLMPCFNIPFQSGDNQVLAQMRRGYTRERFLDIVKSIRERLPDASITADAIVGFPGESEEAFEKTLDLMREVEFEQVNTAAYSPRPNTPAAGPGYVQHTEEVKQERLQRINRLATEHALKRSERFMGREMEVLVEDVDIKNPSMVKGRIPHGRLTYFSGEISELKGKVVKVKITKSCPYHLIAKIVDEYPLK